MDDPQDLLPELRNLSARLESAFQDACDFEFTVQDGRLYLLNARVARRTPAAAVRIATDLFLERKISGRALVKRIQPSEVEAILQPTVILNPNAHELGRGVPASNGAAQGVAAFSSDSAFRLNQNGISVVLLREEVTPEDIHGIEASAGVITFLGGMTSHAAVICRGMGKPCTSGVGWSFNRTGDVITGQGERIREGDHLTIIGTTGVVYAGTADTESPKPLQNDRLLLLLRVIDALSAEGELPNESIGRIWLLRDIIIHGSKTHHQQDPEGRLKCWPTRTEPAVGKAFGALQLRQLQQLIRELGSFQLEDDHVKIWRGLRTYLFRLLTKYIGVGRHSDFCRPLFDPREAVLGKASSRKWGCRNGCRLQLVGEEFFSINSHVPELIDIGTIRLYWAAECERPTDLWRLDRTNIAGEKLLEGSADLKALKIVINGATVSLDLLATVYNSLRRREYFCNWYSSNEISRREICRAMMTPHRMNSRLRKLAESAGLISAKGMITPLGESLLQPSTASERACLPIPIGW